MKTTFATLTLALGAAATPHMKRADTIDDATVLNFALILQQPREHFLFRRPEEAGLPNWARGRFAQVAEHEAAHVAFLSKALGGKATQPCNYSFPYTDPKSFAGLSQAIEGVGVSAYTGTAQYFTDKSYLTASASVLATEARHASWVASAVNKYAVWSGVLDVPLVLNQVYSIAAVFITDCLPRRGLPNLTVKTTRYSPEKPSSSNTRPPPLLQTASHSTARSTPVYAMSNDGNTIAKTIAGPPSSSYVQCRRKAHYPM
ncbi:ferritin-like domain-containing protein [Mycena crocata]|nr:ferritin-like domain-containing protein [Mycena crocata]